MKHRLIALLLALPVMTLAGAFVALVWMDRALDIGSATTFNMSAQVTGSDEGRWIATVIAAGVGVLALVLLALEWWPSRGRIELKGANDETIRLPLAALEASIESDARDVPRVDDAEAAVQQRNEGIAVSLRLTAPPDAEVRSLIDEVTERISSGLTRRYGLDLTQRPDIEMRYSRPRWWHLKRRGSSPAS